MIYFIEYWNAKPEWIALTTEERTEYMGKVGGAIQGLMEQGVKSLLGLKITKLLHFVQTMIISPFGLFQIRRWRMNFKMWSMEQVGIITSSKLIPWGKKIQ